MQPLKLCMILLLVSFLGMGCDDFDPDACVGIEDGGLVTCGFKTQKEDQWHPVLNQCLENYFVNGAEVVPHTFVAYGDNDHIVVEGDVRNILMYGATNVHIINLTGVPNTDTLNLLDPVSTNLVVEFNGTEWIRTQY